MKNKVKKLVMKIKILIFNLFTLFPIKNNYILFESEGDFSDNSFAFFKYLINNNYTKYKFIWFLDNIQRNCPYKINKVKKRRKCIDIKFIYYLATSKYFIYDHCDLYKENNFKKRNNQICLYLSHGFGFKSSKGSNYLIDPPSFDYIISTGLIPAQGNTEWFHVNLNKALVLGYPRLDFFYNSDINRYKEILKVLDIDNKKINFLWMPTFRQSVNKDLSEDYIKNETGLPFFDTKEKLEYFNSYLRDNNSTCYLKLHHLQSELPIFQSFYSNIKLIRDDDLYEKSLQLYEIIPLFDSLISDYSSITVDYLLLDKPIIYILNDYNEYKNSRGIYPENAIDYMVGYHIFAEKELYAALKDILEGKDIYKSDRKKILPLFHKYQDGNSSKRICDYLDLKKGEIL